MTYYGTSHKLWHIKKWNDRKIKLVEKYFENLDDKQSPLVETGEIYFADLGTNIGEEIDKTRPVLIIQRNNHFFRNRNTVFVVPMTSSLKRGSFKVPFSESDLIEQNVETRAGIILVYQSRTISKTRLGQKMAKLSDEKIIEVKMALKKLLQI